MFLDSQVKHEILEANDLTEIPLFYEPPNLPG